MGPVALATYGQGPSQDMPPSLINQLVEDGMSYCFCTKCKIRERWSQRTAGAGAGLELEQSGLERTRAQAEARATTQAGAGAEAGAGARAKAGANRGQKLERPPKLELEPRLELERGRRLERAAPTSTYLCSDRWAQLLNNLWPWSKSESFLHGFNG